MSARADENSGLRPSGPGAGRARTQGLHIEADVVQARIAQFETLDLGRSVGARRPFAGPNLDVSATRNVGDKQGVGAGLARPVARTSFRRF